MPDKKLNKFRCPLCDSILTQTRYYEIIGVWQERAHLERTLKEQLLNVQSEKRKLLLERKSWRTQKKQAAKEAFEKGKEKEKSRADRLSKMLEVNMEKLQEQNKKIKELQEQLKKGTTPQVEGLNLEEELVKELKKEFPEDKIEHYGKTGDIAQRINFKNKQIGIILYECKKTTKFNGAFVDQIKKAMAIRQATYGVLVTTAFKKDTAGFWVEKDILIVHPFGAVYIAKVLRRSIIDIYSLKISRLELEKRSKELMEYIKSDEFKNSVEDSIYRTRSLYEMLKKEIHAHQGVWYDRYIHYRTIHDNVNQLELMTSNILKGLPTKEALASLKLKQLPPPVSGR